MSALLTAFPAALAVEVDLTPEQARDLTRQIRGVAEELAGLLALAYRGRAWVALGYASWKAYCDGEFAGALAGLPVDRRRDVVGVLSDAGMSTRAIAAGTRTCDQTVRADLRLARPDGTGPRVGIDGKTYTATPPTPAPALAVPLTKTARALADLDAAGPAGLTAPELGRKRRWPANIRSAVLSDLHRPGRIARLTETRDGHAVYVMLEHVAGRHTEAPGRRPRRR